jgi:hypothetical protein
LCALNAQITDLLAVDSIHYKVGDKIKMGKAMNGLPEFSNVIQYSKDDVTTLRKPKSPAHDSLVIVGISDNIKQNDYSVKCHYYYLQNTTDSYMTYVFIFNKAIKSGEVISKNPNYFVAPTSEQALEQLKKAKEKLDLGLITKDDYDKKVNELKKYINE